MSFGECKRRGEFCKSRDLEIGTSDGKPNEINMVTEYLKRKKKKKGLHWSTILLDLMKNYPDFLAIGP